MKIQRLSASSFKFYSPEGKIALVDPWLTNDPLWPINERAPDKLREIDVIAITHGHFDHASGIDEIVTHNNKAPIIAQFEYGLSLLSKGKPAIPTSFGATVEFGGLKFSLVPATHTNSEMTSENKMEIVGTAGGYVIEFENAEKVYFSGDTGLTADMKFVVGDYYKPDIAILPVVGMFVMEPEQAAYAANATGCKCVIPCHDFPREISDAANPEAYAEFVKQFPVLETYKKVDRFMEIIRNEYPHIKAVYIPIGETVEVGRS